MSFINWGDETPEQKAHRRKMEEQALIEHAMMRKIFEARSGTASAAAASAGSGSPFPSKLGISTSYIYDDINGDLRIGFVDYAINGFSKVFNTGLNLVDQWIYDINNYNGTYIVDSKGYAIVFSNNVNEHKIFFFTAGGAHIDTIEVTTSDLSIWGINGDWVLLQDYDARKVWWFDGETLRYDFDTFANTSIFTYDYQYNLDGFFIYSLKNGMSRVYINDGLGFRVIMEQDITLTPDISHIHRAYANSRILRVITYDSAEGAYTKLEYFDSDANSLNDYDLSGENYTETYGDVYGTGKHIDSFLNSTTLIMYYCDSVRQIYLDQNHSRVNYGDYFVIGDYVSKGTFTDSISERAVICFNNNSGIYQNGLLEVTYCDFIPMYDDNNAFSTYTLADDEAKLFGRDSIFVADAIFVPVCTDTVADPKQLQVLTFPIGAPATYTSDLIDFNSFQIIQNSFGSGKRYFLIVSDDAYPSPGEVFVFDSVGLSWKSFIFTDVTNGNLVIDTAGDVLTFRCSNDPSDTYYYTATTNILNPGVAPKFGSVYQPTNCKTENGVEPSTLVLQGATSSRLYLFNDAGNDAIIDGGDNMYNGGNQLYSGIAGSIPYTHTQSTGNNGVEATSADFVKDGAVVNGDSYFGGGSSYFTNCYPGLFVCVAKNINVDYFGIEGTTGSDTSGYVSSDPINITVGGTDYTVFYKTTSGGGVDFSSGPIPTVNQIIIIDSQSGDAIQTVGDGALNDLHEISELVASGANDIHYLLLSTYNQSVQVGLTESEITTIATAYLNVVHGYNIADTLSELNANYSEITSLVNSQDTYWLGLVNNSGFTQVDSPYFENVRVGPNLIAGVYFNETNNVCVNLYDTSLQLLATHVTDETEYTHLRVIGDRAYTRTLKQDGTRVWTILNPEKFAKKSVFAVNDFFAENNDYPNW
jgi:hypothetical protein